VDADIEALCDGHMRAWTMMQVRIRVEGCCGALLTVSPADVWPGIFRPADVAAHAACEVARISLLSTSNGVVGFKEAQKPCQHLDGQSVAMALS
jgi:hypothetical protein